MQTQVTAEDHAQVRRPFTTGVSVEVRVPCCHQAHTEPQGWSLGSMLQQGLYRSGWSVLPSWAIVSSGPQLLAQGHV